MLRMERTVEIDGFPATYNKLKAKNYLQHSCQFELVDLKIDGCKGTVTVRNDEEAEKLIRTLPISLNFGGNKYDLTYRGCTQYQSQQQLSPFRHGSPRQAAALPSSVENRFQRDQVGQEQRYASSVSRYRPQPAPTTYDSQTPGYLESPSPRKAQQYPGLHHQECDPMEVDHEYPFHFQSGDHGGSPQHHQRPSTMQAWPTEQAAVRTGRLDLSFQPRPSVNQPVIDLKMVYNWSTLPRPVGQAGERGLLLQGMVQDMSPKDILKVFEKGRSNVRQIFFLPDGLFVAFVHPSEADGYVDNKHFRVGSNTVKVFPKVIPESYRNKLVLKNFHKSLANMREAVLKLNLQNCSTKGTIPKHVETVHANVRVVEYDEDLDPEDLKNIRDNFMEEHKHKNSQILPLMKTDCLRATGMATSVDSIRVIVENRTTTGGGKVTRIDKVKDRSFLIYLTSYKDAEAIHEKMKGETVKFDDCEFKLELYFHCLSDCHKNLAETHPLDSYYTAWQDHEAVPAVFEYGAVAPELMKFFAKKREHLQYLESSLQYLAKAEVLDDNSGFKVIPAVDENRAEVCPKDHFEFKTICSEKIKKFLNSYVSKTESFNSDNLERLRQHKLDPKVEPDYAGDDDVMMQWTGSRKDNLILTGLKEEVESTLTCMLQLADIDNTDLKLQKGQYRWISECGYIEEKLRSLKVGVQCREDTNTFILTGNREEVANARMAVLQEVLQLSREKFQVSDSDQNEYLCRRSNQEVVIGQAQKIFKTACIPAILTIENGVPSIWSHMDDMGEANRSLKIALSTKSFGMPSPAHKDILKQPGWTTLIRELEKLHMLEIREKQSCLVIVGFKESVTGAVPKVTKFFEENLMEDEIFHTSYGQAKNITEFLTEFKTVCDLHKFKYGLKYGQNGGIRITGRRQELKKVVRQLTNWSKRVKYKSQTFKKYDILEYFESCTGNDLLTSISSKNKCTILVGTNAWPTESHSDDLEETTDQFLPLTVTVRKGDITTEKNDAIVNTVGQDFDLSLGLVSKAIQKKGGGQIQDELNAASDPYIRVTKSGHLQCRMIIHILAPRKIHEIGICLTSILEKAEIKNCTSVSIPAIGTGNLDFPSSAVARIMRRALKEYAKSQQRSATLKKVDIVIFDRSKLADFKASLISNQSDDEAFSDNDSLYHGASSSSTPSPSFATPHNELNEIGSAVTNRSSTAASGTSTSSSVLLGPITVKVVQGDITNQTTDVIVTSAGSDFNLSNGLVARVILQKGGQQIQTELSAQTDGSFRVTSAGKLPCKQIFHVVIPDDVTEIKDCIINILEMAEKKQHTSVSLPAIGTGTLKLPSGDMARIMNEAFTEFVTRNSQTKSLKVVAVVIFDRQFFQDFKTALIGGQAANTQPRPSAFSMGSSQNRSSSSVSFGPFTVSVRQGDITAEKNDAIAISIASSFDLSRGLVAQAVLKKGGQQLQKELSKANGSMLRMTKGGNLSCKKIFYFVVPDKADRIQKSIENILQKADDEQCTSLSLPAIGTGNLNLAGSVIAKIMNQAFTEFATNNPQTKSLKVVDVVIYIPSLLQDFKSGLMTGPTFGATASGASSGTSVSSVKVGPLAISVEQGDITDQSSDVIVISTGSDFNLSQGLVGKAILKKGGQQIQADVTSVSGKLLRVTNAGNLKCKKIFHVVIEKLDKIRQIVLAILEEAEKLQCTSLSIPAIGTGAMKQTSNSVADLMREGIDDFIAKNPQTSHLRKVVIVIFEQSRMNEFLNGLILAYVGTAPSIQQKCVATVKKGFHAVKASVKKCDDSSTKLGPLHICIRQGDITEDKSDVIVNSTRSTFDLSPGAVSAAILKKGGKEIQDEVLKETGQRLRITGSGKLPCKNIFHVAFPDTETGIRDCLSEVLVQAENMKFKSVAIPAVGTGNKKLSQLSLPRQMVDAFDEFVSSYPSINHLKTVNVVVFDKSMMSHFVRGIVQGVSQGAAFRRRPKSSHGQDLDCVTLHFYAQELGYIEQALDDIRKELDQDFFEDSIKVEQIAELSRAELASLTEIGHRHNVQVVFKKTDKRVIVRGLRSGVWKASRKILETLHDYAEARNLQSFTAYYWQYQEADKTWKNFVPSADKELELLYKEYGQASSKGSKEATIEFEGHRSNFYVDFTDPHQMTITGYDVFHIRREVKDDLPAHWDQMNAKAFMQVDLKPSSAEYLDVKHQMNRTLPKCDIKSVVRVQNKDLYTKYQVQKRLRQKTCKTTPMERKLFHGTSEAVQIANYGFDRSYAGKNATYFGRGSYFARDADYSDQPKYSRPDLTTGIKTMILADVFTGDFCEGDESMITAPAKPGTTTQYDSVVNDVSNPQIFVVFPDASVYPAYVIKYK